MKPDLLEPFVSIICGTYNRGNLLPRAIDSVVSQNFTSWELLIVDDGSIDNTFEVIEPYLKDKRIRYFQLESNRGVGVARNKGVALARAGWVVLLDSDNSLAPGAIANMYSLAKSSSNILMHKFVVKSFDAKIMCDSPKCSITISGKDYLCGKMRGEYHTLVAKKCLVSVPFFEKFSGGEGVVWARIALMVEEVSYHPYVTAFYDTKGGDRLSLKGKNYDRLFRVFAADISMLWREYLRNCPKQLMLRIMKFVIYGVASRLKG